MKNISRWAKWHIKTARLLIVCIRILLTWMAFYTGTALSKMGVYLSSGPVYGAAFFILLIVVAAYPRRNLHRSGSLSYLRQKACDFILPLSSFLVIVTMVNNSDLPSFSGAYGINPIEKKTATEILASGKTREQLTRKEKRILKKEFFKQLKVYVAAQITGQKETSGKAWKIALAIIALVGLLYLLAALACSLSCSGSDAAAIVVTVLGVTGLIIGFIAVVKRIHRGPKEVSAG